MGSVIEDVRAIQRACEAASTHDELKIAAKKVGEGKEKAKQVDASLGSLIADLDQHIGKFVE